MPVACRIAQRQGDVEPVPLQDDAVLLRIEAGVIDVLASDLAEHLARRVADGQQKAPLGRETTGEPGQGATLLVRGQVEKTVPAKDRVECAVDVEVADILLKPPRSGVSASGDPKHGRHLVDPCHIVPRGDEVGGHRIA